MPCASPSPGVRWKQPASLGMAWGGTSPSREHSACSPTVPCHDWATGGRGAEQFCPSDPGGPAGATVASAGHGAQEEPWRTWGCGPSRLRSWGRWVTWPHPGLLGPGPQDTPPTDQQQGPNPEPRSVHAALPLHPSTDCFPLPSQLTSEPLNPTLRRHHLELRQGTRQQVSEELVK